MRFSRVWLVFVAVAIATLQLVTPVFAQSPEKTPAGTPISATPEAVGDPLVGRLGGALSTVVDRFGSPDFTSDELIRYDDIDLDGLSTILVVHYDPDETITRMTLVYPVRPEILAEPVGIIPIAALVSPADGHCDVASQPSGFGSEVYSCHSDALAEVFTPDRMDDLGITQGDPGDYSIAVDPLPDDWFELIIQPGIDGETSIATPETETPETSPESAATPVDQYPVLTDTDALMNGDIPLNTSLSFTGTILTLQIAEFGKQFRLGEDRTLGVSSLFQVRIPSANPGEDTVLFVGYNGDANDLAIDTTVVVSGVNYGIQCFDNAVGKEICQPLIAADTVVIEK